MIPSMGCLYELGPIFRPWLRLIVVISISNFSTRVVRRVDRSSPWSNFSCRCISFFSMGKFYIVYWGFFPPEECRNESHFRNPVWCDFFFLFFSWIRAWDKFMPKMPMMESMARSITVLVTQNLPSPWTPSQGSYHWRGRYLTRKSLNMISLSWLKIGVPNQDLPLVLQIRQRFTCQFVR